MNPLAWRVSQFMPACGFAGAEGAPPPPLLDVTACVRPAARCAALLGPAAIYLDHHQIDDVARSAVSNFPGQFMVQDDVSGHILPDQQSKIPNPKEK